MPRKPRTPCSQPGCSELTNGGACPEHKRQREQQRGSASKRGYDVDWQRKRKAYLYANSWCVLCSRAANVADHWPLSRKQLEERHEPNPDAPKHLRPLCKSCHNSETAKNQPGGWAAEKANSTPPNLHDVPPF
ncbi:HNH endonuclease [Streptomyces sp. WAC 06783]|nr:HNH endonuclease [Streptomyces sp. WAC 06783]